MEQESVYQSVKEAIAEAPEFLKDFSSLTIFEIAYSRIQGVEHPYDLAAKLERPANLEIQYYQCRSKWSSTSALSKEHFSLMTLGQNLLREKATIEKEIPALEKVYQAAHMTEALIDEAVEHLAIEIADGGGWIIEGLQHYIKRTAGIDSKSTQPLLAKAVDNDIGRDCRSWVPRMGYAEVLRQPII